jgi:hypothetical protein
MRLTRLLLLPLLLLLALPVAAKQPKSIYDQARHQVLTYSWYTVFDNITLSVQGHSVYIGGQVTQPYKKADLGRLMKNIKSVDTVYNSIEVLPLSFFDDRIRMAVYRAIYRDPYFIQYTNQPIPSIHIIVKNGNVTLEGVVATQMDDTKARLDADGVESFSVTDHLRIEGR